LIECQHSFKELKEEEGEGEGEGDKKLYLNDILEEVKEG